MLQRIYDVEQKSKEWLALRLEKITASDIPALLCFKKSENYYNKTATQWFLEKTGQYKETLTDYKKELFKKGELSENTVVLKHFSKKWHERSGIYVNGCFMASLDVLDTERGVILEVKYTDSKNVFDKYASLEHLSFYQLAFQMWLLEKKEGSIIVNYVNNEGVSKIVGFKIFDTSPQYLEVVENIDYFRSVHAAIQEKRNPFLEQTDSKFQDLIDAISEQEEIISTHKDILESYKSALEDQLIENEFKTAKVDGVLYKYTIKECIRKTKKLKQGLSQEDVFVFEENSFKKISKTKA